MSVAAAEHTLGHLRILASAGSGKTYALTSRYLALVAHSAPPQRILASTFTRLAAGEIRERILMRLVRALEDESDRAGLARAISDDDHAPPLPRQHVLELLATLTRQVDALNIRTLDSFFASIVTGFSLELGVPPGATVVDESEDAMLREEAIDLLLDERRAQDLIELLRLLTQGRSDRAVAGTILETVNDLFALHTQAIPDAWSTLRRPGGGLRPGELAAAIELLSALELPAHRSIVEAHSRSVQAALDRDWGSFLAKGYAQKIAAGQTEYYRQPITDQIAAAYTPLIAHARAELVGRIVEKNDAARRLLDQFAAQFESLKRERGALTFSDLVNTLDRADFSGALADIAYRIDASIDHILLDEFQDTSVPQWRVLAPLARELVSDETSGRTFFCVGDVKQSIYGWRDAAPEVMEHLGELLYGEGGADLLADMVLAKSWRSSDVIMRAVNRVFESLSTNDALDALPEVARHWQETFTHHTAALGDLPGYAELRCVRRADDEEDQKALRLREAARIAANLHQAAPDLTIGILTRTNAGVAQVLFELNRLGAPATGRGGGPLTDAAPVNVILDLLHLADHPDDTVAAFNLGTSPLAGPLEIPAGIAESDVAGRHRVARRVRAQIQDEGLAGTLRRIVAMIAPACDDRDLRRACGVVQQAERFEQLGAADLARFIGQVESRAVTDATPSPIEVLTVHGSKGREFDAVILPELDRPFKGSTPSAVCQRDGVTGPITRLCTYISKDLRTLTPDVDDLFESHTQRTVREALGLLYVAMTRAKQGLYMLVDPPGLTQQGPSQTIPKSHAGVLRCAFGQPVPDEDSVMYVDGEAGWHLEAQQKRVARRREEESHHAAPPPRRGPIQLRPSSERTRVLRAAASAPPSAEPDASGTLRLRQNTEAQDRGTAIHLLFEQLEWIEDFTIDEAALTRLIHHRLPRRGAEWAQQQVSDFVTMLEAPEVRAMLSLPSPPGRGAGGEGKRRHSPHRTTSDPQTTAGQQKSLAHTTAPDAPTHPPAPSLKGRGSESPPPSHGGGREGGRTKVRREQRFARLTDDGEIQQGVIDRLVIEEDQTGNPIRAVIIDFKTDDIDARDVAGRAKQHASQLNTYRAAAASLLGLAPYRITMHLVFLVPAIAVVVESD